MNEKSSNGEKIDKNFLENSGASASTIDAYGKSLKGFRKELNKTTKDRKEASATMKDYNEYLSKNGEETIRSTSVTKDLGATSNLSTMQTAISESMSNTGVTADTLKSLASAVSDNVEGYDFTKKNLFAESAKGIKVTYEVQDTVARTKANNLESANYTDIGGSQMAILS